MQIVSTGTCKKKSFMRMLNSAFLFFFGLALLCAAPGWCKSYGSRNDQDALRERRHVSDGRRSEGSDRFGQSRTREQSSYGTNRSRNKAQQWEKLSPNRKDELRHNMDRFKNLPPEERSLYQKRHQQMQQLPPDEQQEIRSKLRQKDRLSPEEKEEIRKKFR